MSHSRYSLSSDRSARQPDHFFASLLADIQELDSNMQYLVYENHAKFIKASETIREVNTDLVLRACVGMDCE